MTDPSPSRRYPAANVCIYCGSTEKLSDEHIIPFALAGQVVLPRASCARCAKITSQFERTVTQSLYGNLRKRLGYPSRRKPLRDRFIEATDAVTGKRVSFRPEEAPLSVPIMNFLPPGILREPPVEAPNFVGSSISIHDVGATDQTRWSELGSGTYTFDQPIEIDAWALMLAKVAHAQAVADFGVENFTPFLPQYILGNKKGVYTYVGGSPVEIKGSNLHELLLHVGYPDHGSKADFMVLVSVRLFAAYGFPTVLVVVGRANEEWAWREAARRQTLS